MVVSKSQKVEIVGELKRLAKDSQSVSILDMAATPAGQLLKIKKKMEGKITLRMARKALLVRALNEAGIGELAKKVDGLPAGSPALLFSTEDPFKLFQMIKKSRATAAAKAGDIVTKDIVIKKGPTPLSPGPAISTLQKVGLKTRVEGGKIAVSDDKVVVKAGETVTEDAAGVLNMLKIEPMEIGLNLLVSYYDNMIYSKDVLDVSVEEYIANIERAAREGVNLSINIGYPTKFTIEMMISKAFTESRSLGIEAGIMEKDVMPEIITKACREAASLSDVVKISEA